MKKLLLACSLLGVISAANAQPAQPMMTDHPKGEHMEMRMHAFDPAEHAAQLQKSLQLSDEQTAKVKKVFEENAKQRQTLEEKYKPQFEAFRADMKKLHEQTHTQLNGILTPKQQQAFAAQRKGYDGEMCPHDGDDDHMHGHDHGDKMPMK